MMSVKRGTSTYSSASQSQPVKGEGANNVSADEFKKAFGDQNLAEVLNKAADKNYVDPSKKLRAVGNNQMDKDAFFKLMLAQMKNQDPANPMQSHEMAAQLAQFTSLEQLNNIHGVLEGMSKAQQPSSNYQALALIGKKVSGDSSKLTRAAGDTKHEFAFDMMGDAAKGTMVIKDASGNVVKKLELGALKKGANRVEWNGLTDDGSPARSGEYHVGIDAKSSQGTKVYAKTSFSGRITGLNYTADGPVLLVGKQSLKLSDVAKIEEAAPEDSVPSLPLNASGPAVAANAKAGASMPVAAAPAATMQGKTFLPLNPQLTPQSGSQPQAQAAPPDQQEQFIPPAEDPDPKLASNIGDVPMSQEMLNRLQRELK